MQKSWLSKKTLTVVGIVTAVVVLACIITVVFLNNYFTPVKPVITANLPTQFSTEKTMTLTGSILASCPCTVIATINDRSLELDEHGNFSYDLTLPAAGNSVDVTIVAKATGTFWNTSSEMSAKNHSLWRSEIPLTLVEPKKENDTEKYSLQITTAPNADITISGYFTQEVANPSLSPAMEEIKATSNDNGTATVELPFDNAYMTTQAKYKVTVAKESFKKQEKELFVKNTQYDPSRVAEAKKEAARIEAEKIEANRIQDLIASMNYFDGEGAVEIAVGTNGFKKSKSLGYYTVNNPNEFEYVGIPIIVKNAGIMEEHINPLYFTIQDKNGRTYNFDEATYSTGGRLEATNLQAGAKTDGWLTFILPKSEKEFTLVYSNGLGDTARKKLYIK